MTDLNHVNFQLAQKFDDKYEVSVASGGCGIDLYEREEYRIWTGDAWALEYRITHVSTFDDLAEAEFELLD